MITLTEDKTSSKAKKAKYFLVSAFEMLFHAIGIYDKQKVLVHTVFHHIY